MPHDSSDVERACVRLSEIIERVIAGEERRVSCWFGSSPVAVVPLADLGRLERADVARRQAPAEGGIAMVPVNSDVELEAD
jgi:hypothetical protein